MPSKVLIQAANDFDRRKVLIEEGIHGGESLTINHKEVLQHVRKLRDRFVKGVMSGLECWTDTHPSGFYKVFIKNENTGLVTIDSKTALRLTLKISSLLTVRMVN